MVSVKFTVHDRCYIREVSDLLKQLLESGDTESSMKMQSIITVFLASVVLADWTTRQWDAIVVGSGPAGIIVADRLSEVGLSTLMLESGGPSYWIAGRLERPSWLTNTNLSRVDVPGLYSSIFSSSSSPLLCGNRYNAFGGCTIGGGSAINAGLYFRPPDSDFDVTFPEGWHADSFSSAFHKLQTRILGTSIPSADGKVYLNSTYNVTSEFLHKAGYVKYQLNSEYNNKKKAYGRTIFDYEGGQRGGPVKTYLQSALSRSNFALVSGATVVNATRVGPKISSIVVSYNSTTRTIVLNDRGLLVFSGGALFSPQLLMASAIGPETQLGNLAGAGKISADRMDWIINEAVGENLYDNPDTLLVFESDAVQPYTYSYEQPIVSDEKLYLSKRSGPYAYPGETMVLFDSVVSSDNRTVAVHLSSAIGVVKGQFEIRVYGTSGLRSRGKVTLDSLFRPFQAGTLYSDPAGLDATDVAGYIQKLLAAASGSGINCLNLDSTSTITQITEWITSNAGQTNHWGGSCSLGTVVDTNTRVIGTDNLFVVDGSVVPGLLSVNPQMAIMAVAELASEKILQLRGSSSMAVSAMSTGVQTRSIIAATATPLGETFTLNATSPLTNSHSKGYSSLSMSTVFCIFSLAFWVLFA
ncbi:Cellobiose dehydrogenase [Neolecta irregularis DAH-3]|uniref:Cellobiose dehydrogenase n=1 Tax=Neolecta irregularis (strain DAH-3) TaxID=1198029 RepID=A0A1U7LHD2_NEOID|nr:Cellobiose dehydrogenase [Neolecta irregularis DAH-3]|eukprot:OLL22054.1 Cellobiose dehydrogenase [Neolecta irregularis DAH-3]